MGKIIGIFSSTLMNIFRYIEELKDRCSVYPYNTLRNENYHFVHLIFSLCIYKCVFKLQKSQMLPVTNEAIKS